MDKTKYFVVGTVVTALLGGSGYNYYISDVSEDGINTTKQYESYRALPYKDSGGVITQGYGSTFKPDGTRIKLTDEPISQKEALQYLHSHIKRYSKQFNLSLQNVPLSQTEYDLYADFTYQYGIDAWKQSSMLKNLRQAKYTEACKSLESWRFSRVGKKKIKVDCRIDSRCRGVWVRQKQRMEKCLGENL